MPVGKGKYSDLAEDILLKTQAGMVVLMVVDGDQGYDFSVVSLSPDLSSLPEYLREMAQQIEEDTKGAPNENSN